MYQKCPNCGEWCHAEIRSFKDKALDAGVKSYQESSQLGSLIGGVFGKKGSNIGKIVGGAWASEFLVGKSLLGGLADPDCHFVCPQCGYEWEANADEDQSGELQSDTEELIRTIAELVSSIETEEDYEQINTLCKELDSRDCSEAYYWRAKAQYELAHVFWNLLSSCSGDTDEEREKSEEYGCKRSEWFNLAYKTINDSIDFYISDYDYYQEKDGGHALAWAINLRAWIEHGIAYDIDDITAARNSFIDAMDTDFDDIREDAMRGYQNCTDRLLAKFNNYVTIKDEVAECLNDEDEEMRYVANELIAEAEDSKFSNLPYSKRQFVFITKEGAKNVAGCTDPTGNIRYVFSLDEIPIELKFPVGHPQRNTLYVANPAQKGQYVPYKDAEDKLFHDKVNDFIRLSQCLGATEISFHSIKGESVSQNFVSSSNASGGVNIKGNSVTGEYGLKNTENNTYNSSKEVELTRRYDPIHKPYCPDDVAWLSLDPEWQKFVRQRLEGNILESSMRISSAESICSNTNTLRDVKAAFENMMITVDANYDSEEDNTFSSSESTEWQISVKFRSIRDFTEQCSLPSQQVSSLRLSPAEEKYKEEVLFVLEDGVIGDAERRLLERKRQKFGVSEERAGLIEESCMPTLSDEEEEYIETYKDMLADGEISERRRKILNKEAASLGISQSRALELEAMI